MSVVWTLPLFDCRQAGRLEAEAQWTGALAAFERLAEAEPPRRGRDPSLAKAAYRLGAASLAMRGRRQSVPRSKSIHREARQEIYCYS